MNKRSDSFKCLENEVFKPLSRPSGQGNIISRKLTKGMTVVGETGTDGIVYKTSITESSVCKAKDFVRHSVYFKGRETPSVELNVYGGSKDIKIIREDVSRIYEFIEGLIDFSSPEDMPYENFRGYADSLNGERKEEKTFEKRFLEMKNGYTSTAKINKKEKTSKHDYLKLSVSRGSSEHENASCEIRSEKKSRDSREANSLLGPFLKEMEKITVVRDYREPAESSWLPDWASGR